MRSAIRNAIFEVSALKGTDAKWDAIRVAALVGAHLVVDDLESKGKAEHVGRVDAYWDVWLKHCGVLCERDGIVYAYALKPVELRK